jgi:predicted pyridoxine 5'-phosphate oxidase superfamily flavin-nucleotide-binding protein
MNWNKPGSEGEHRLQAEFGTAQRALAFYDRQVLEHLTPTMCDYIARQEMMFLATADARGDCDCSLRTGEPGFVHVIDDRTLAYPELRGNGVMASLGNILENPHVAIAFFDFCGTTVGLHVNGSARIVNSPVLESLPSVRESYGKAIERWVVVHVEEAYIHCSKHIPLMKKLDKRIDWGTDNVAQKGGDFFKAKREPRPWADPSSACPSTVPPPPDEAPTQPTSAVVKASSADPPPGEETPIDFGLLGQPR